MKMGFLLSLSVFVGSLMGGTGENAAVSPEYFHDVEVKHGKREYSIEKRRVR